MIRDCQQCRDLLDAYLASELLVETTDQVLRHLASCGRCRREARNRAHLRRMLRRVRSAEAPPDLAARVLRRIEAEIASQTIRGAASEGARPAPASAAATVLMSGPMPIAASTAASPSSPSASARPRSRGRRGRRAARVRTSTPAPVRHDRLPRSPWLRVALGVAATLVFALILAGRWYEAPLSAAELLRQSSDVELASATRGDAVTHRVMTLEVRALPAGTLVGRQRIEVWQSAASRIRAKRAFDESQRLMAGEWTRPDGSEAVYYRGEAPRVATAPASADGAAHPKLPALLDRQEPWRMDLSAADIRSFAGEARPGTVDVRPAAYVISYRGISISTGQTAALTVTLSRPQLRPIRQTVIVDGPSGQREYSLEEERFAELRREDIRAAVFEPEAELTGAAPEAVAALSAPAPAPASRPAAAAIDTPEPLMEPGLEVAALYRLHQANACLFDHATVRSVDGHALYIDAVAEASRRDLLLAALKPFEADPRVHVSVQTASAADAVEPGITTTAATTSTSVAMTIGVDVTPDTPAYARVVASLRERTMAAFGSGASRPPDAVLAREIDGASMRLARRVLERADDARRHAEALEALVARGAADPAWRGDLNATATWLTMIRDHGRAFRQQLARLRDDLGPIFPPPADDRGDAIERPASTHSMADLAAAAQALASTAAAQQARLRAAFVQAGGEAQTGNSHSAGAGAHLAGAPTAGAGTIDATFWLALSRTDRLAASLDDPWILN